MRYKYSKCAKLHVGTKTLNLFILAMCISSSLLSKRNCARERTFFVSPGNGDFRAINFFHQKLILPTDAFHKIARITHALKKNAHKNKIHLNLYLH